MIIEIWLLGVAAIKLMYLKAKRLFFLVLIVYTAFWAINIAMSSVYVFASMTFISGLAILTAMYLIVLFNNSVFKSNSMLQQPVFWLSISTILYCSCDIPYFGLHNYLIANSPAIAHKLININTVLDVIRYPLVAISFILLGRQKQVVLNAA